MVNYKWTPLKKYKFKGSIPKREGTLIENLQEEAKLPFSINVKGGEKEKKHDDKESMMVERKEVWW